MMWEAIRTGWQKYRQDFSRLTLLSILRTAFPLLLFVLVVLPFLFLGINFLSNPDLISALPKVYLGFLGAYYFPLVVLTFLASPFFTFLILSGALTKDEFSPAFLLIKKNYFRLIVDSTILLLIVFSFLIESLFFYLINRFLGFLGILLLLYVYSRLYLWDIFALKGNKHPLFSSWNATRGRFLWVFLFLAFFALLKGSLPSFLTFLVVFIDPLLATSKIALLKGIERKNNKVR